MNFNLLKIKKKFTWLTTAVIIVIIFTFIMSYTPVPSNELINQRIYETLGVNVTMDYSITNYKQNLIFLGGGDYSEDCELLFNKKDFMELLSRIDTSKWTKYNNLLGIQDNYIEYENTAFNWYKYNLDLFNQKLICTWGYE